MTAETTRVFKAGDRVYVKGDRLGTVVATIRPEPGRVTVRLDSGGLYGTANVDDMARAVTITLPESVARRHVEQLADSLRQLQESDLSEEEFDEAWLIVNAFSAALRSIH